MSVSGISSTSFFDSTQQSVQSNRQKFQKEFQQLGQDLQSGNLSAAQSDFATLQGLGPQSSSTSSTQSTSPMATELTQLSKDLQSGNVTAAQQDYTTLQQDFQSQAAQSGGHYHHHHSSSSSDSNSFSQLLSQLGQALQTGNLGAAQQAYTTMQQTMQQFETSGTAASTTASASTGLTANA